MMRKGAVALLGLAVAACSTVGPEIGPGSVAPTPPPPPPPPAASIIGHGAYHTRSGAHGDCAGQSVALMRDTPSFRRRMIALYGSPEGARLPVATVKARSARLGPAEENPLAESVQCDGAGGFNFREISPGSYFIIARLKVTSAQGASDDVVVMRHVAVVVGESRDVFLAPAP
jgi:hypothetical protein